MTSLDRRAFIKVFLASTLFQGCAGVPFNRAYTGQLLFSNELTGNLHFGSETLSWSSETLAWM